MRPLVLALLAPFPLLAHAAHGQHEPAYSGQEQRSIKALSDNEVKQYLNGEGMGFARAAELNHYPGPMHVLELSEKLGLTPAQRKDVEELMKSHKEDARALGAKVVAAEQSLDALFRSGKVSESELATAVRAAAAAQGEYRLSHLETHRRLKGLLTPGQVARYDELRGYSRGAASKHDMRH